MEEPDPAGYDRCVKRSIPVLQGPRTVELTGPKPVLMGLTVAVAFMAQPRT